MKINWKLDKEVVRFFRVVYLFQLDLCFFFVLVKIGVLFLVEDIIEIG